MCGESKKSFTLFLFFQKYDFYKSNGLVYSKNNLPKIKMKILQNSKSRFQILDKKSICMDESGSSQQK